MTRTLLLPTLCLLAASCVADVPEQPAPSRSAAPPDLPLGDRIAPKADDGTWGPATRCKPLPEPAPLGSPMIVVSLDGMTARLFDREGGYDRTFPVGVGTIDPETGLSLTPTSDSAPDGLFYMRTEWEPVSDGPTPDDAPWGWNQDCRIWWSDPETGETMPVFAGLPFLRLDGPPTLGYAFHGPIDNFTMPTGGTLRRGFVSHGCIRMEAEDIKELWRRVQGRKVPVRIQRSVERRRDGAAVAATDNWFLSPCDADSDCRYDGGLCVRNPIGGRGYCSARCDGYCPDKAGYPVSMCVAGGDGGHCTLRATDLNATCDRYDHFVPAVVERYAADGSGEVCVPGSGGWIGDRCATDDDCDGGTCSSLGDGPRVCTEACDRFCPDSAGDAPTLCVADPADGGVCVARCTRDDDCAHGLVCRRAVRNGDDPFATTACVAPTE